MESISGLDSLGNWIAAFSGSTGFSIITWSPSIRLRIRRRCLFFEFKATDEQTPIITETDDRIVILYRGRVGGFLSHGTPSPRLHNFRPQQNSPSPAGSDYSTA